MTKVEIKKHVVISVESSGKLELLARQIGQSRKATCEQSIDYYAGHIRNGQPDKINVRLEKLLRIFNDRLEELIA
jgi:hypothetical protein